MSTKTVTRCESILHLCDPLPGAPKRYPAGRVCAHPGCGTVLSTYNRESRCYRHDGVIQVTAADIERGVFGTKTCTKCGVAKPANLDYFGIDVRRRDGLRGACRECRAAQGRARYRDAEGSRQAAAEAVRQHIVSLKAAGMTQGEIARAAKVRHQTLASIVNGWTKYVKTGTGDRILAVEVRG